MEHNHLVSPPQAPSLGTLLRAAREARGLSLRDVERELGVNRGYLSALEIGKQRCSPAFLWACVRRYGVPTVGMFTGLHRHLQDAVVGHLVRPLAPLRAAGYRLELRRPDGSLLSAHDLGTGALELYLRPEEIRLGLAAGDDEEVEVPLAAD